MKFLLDMNLAPRWAEFLQKAGMEALHWSRLGTANATDVEHSPQLVPRYAQSRLLHTIFFAPIKPPRHGDSPLGNDGAIYQNSDASDLGVGGESSCGAGDEYKY